MDPRLPTVFPDFKCALFGRKKKHIEHIETYNKRGYLFLFCFFFFQMYLFCLYSYNVEFWNALSQQILS